MSWETFLKGPLGRDCSDRLLQRRSAHAVGIDSVFRSLRDRPQDPKSRDRRNYSATGQRVDEPDRAKSHRLRRRIPERVTAPDPRSRSSFHESVSRDPEILRCRTSEASRTKPKPECLRGALRSFHQSRVPGPNHSNWESGIYATPDRRDRDNWPISSTIRAPTPPFALMRRSLHELGCSWI